MNTTSNEEKAALSTESPTRRVSSESFPTDTVGIWIEMSDAALADSHGEGLIRWARAFVRGLDQIAGVQRIVIPCSRSAEPALARLFSEADEAHDSTRLLSRKLVFPCLTTSSSLLSRLRTWADRKRTRCKQRLETLGATANPLTWFAPLFALAKESPSSLGLIILTVSRLGKLMLASGGLVLSEALRPIVRRIASPAEALARKANRHFSRITWVIPNPGWPAATMLRGRKILNIADIVYREFPLPGVSAAELEEHAESLKINAVVASKVVCFSNHVARRHIAAALPDVSSKTVVIPHAPFPTARPSLNSTDSRHQLGRALRRHFTETLPHRHFCDFPFENVDYILVSSKCRPYKNYAAVLDTYEYVLRHARRNVKLVVTAHLSGNPDLSAILHHKGLVFDVAEATNVPEEVHTLLIQNAKMLLIPTLFEGGMPFGFAEAVGLGTPCGLARIPAVEETLTAEELSSPEYFQPTDSRSLTEAVLHILDHRDAVLGRQETIRRRLLERTWKDVAAAYLAPLASHPSHVSAQSTLV